MYLCELHSNQASQLDFLGRETDSIIGKEPKCRSRFTIFLYFQGESGVSGLVSNDTRMIAAQNKLAISGPVHTEPKRAKAIRFCFMRFRNISVKTDSLRNRIELLKRCSKYSRRWFSTEKSGAHQACAHTACAVYTNIQS